MNKSDKYYLKKGKLELSMLDEDDSENRLEPVESSQKKDLFRNLEFEHTNRLREADQKPQQTLKLDKDIYNTLHTMGQFLTKINVPQGANIPIKKSMASAKAQKLEQTPIGQLGDLGDTKRMNMVKLEAMAIELEYSSQKVRQGQMEQEIAVVQEEGKINSGDEVHSISDVNEEGMTESCEQIGLEKVKYLDKNILSNESEMRNTLNQNNIDHIVSSFFESKEPQYHASKELKKHIEKQISAIRNYK